MTGWQPLRTVAGLTALRDAYGQNMSGLVPETGVYLADDGWWIALTGAPIPATTLHWSMGVMCGKTRSPLWNECSQSDCAPLSCSPGRVWMPRPPSRMQGGCA